MVNKRGLQSYVGEVTNAVLGIAFGSHVPANMRRYVYKIKTVNLFAGVNLLEFGHEDAATPVVQHVLDYIGHTTQYEMWNDPDDLKEDALPIYIVPAGSQLWGRAGAAGNIYVYVLYEDKE